MQVRRASARPAAHDNDYAGQTPGGSLPDSDPGDVLE